jgi:hypothetical protein
MHPLDQDNVGVLLRASNTMCFPSGVMSKPRRLPLFVSFVSCRLRASTEREMGLVEKR